jgi:hypothetical protein
MLLGNRDTKRIAAGMYPWVFPMPDATTADSHTLLGHPMQGTTPAALSHAESAEEAILGDVQAEELQVAQHCGNVHSESFQFLEPCLAKGSWGSFVHRLGEDPHAADAQPKWEVRCCRGCLSAPTPSPGTERGGGGGRGGESERKRKEGEGGGGEGQGVPCTYIYVNSCLCTLNGQELHICTDTYV